MGVGLKGDMRTMRKWTATNAVRVLKRKEKKDIILKNMKLDGVDELLLSKNYGAKQYLKRGTIIHCYFCNKMFYVRPSAIGDRNFCSKRCSELGKRGKPRRGKIFTCRICKKDFYRSPNRLVNKEYFCSRACSNIGKKVKGSKIELKCKKCNKNFMAYKSYIKVSGQKFCSKKCKGLSMRLNKNKGWKGGVALKKSLWRVFSEYIRQRDGGVCISCGKGDFWRNMDAGHYVPKTAGLSLYFDERNVNCQCTYCNRWMHGNLSRYAIALRKKHGETILEELDSERVKIKKIEPAEYNRLIDYYKEKTKALKSLEACPNQLD